jgi:glycerol-3-phosphate acyltransferase PlsY
MIALGLDAQGTLTIPTQLLLVSLLLFVGFVPITLLVVHLFRTEGVTSAGSQRWDVIEISRCMGFWPAGFLAFMGEAGKAAGAVFLLTPAGLRLWLPTVGWDLQQADMGMAWVGGAMLLLGHCFNPIMRFQGGRGISCLAGCLVVLSPFAALAAALGAALCAMKTRQAELSSLCGLMAAAMVHLVVIQKGTPEWIGVLMLLFVAYRHRADLDRLLDARERTA